MGLQYINLEARRKTGEDNHNEINQHNIIIVPTLSDVKTKWIFDCFLYQLSMNSTMTTYNLGTTKQNP